MFFIVKFEQISQIVLVFPLSSLNKDVPTGNLRYGSINPQAVARRYSVRKVFLEICQNSQDNTCARVSFLIKF